MRVVSLVITVPVLETTLCVWCDNRSKKWKHNSAKSFAF